jgi:hypothetical protein
VEGSCVAERLVASQEGLSSMKLVSSNMSEEMDTKEKKHVS